MPESIFVFGSNLAGRHGAGAALTAARQYGAKPREGVGRTGQAYAIPTKDGDLNVLGLNQIRWHVDNFIAYAKANPELSFYVTAVGTGYAGYKDTDMAPLFLFAPANCGLPEEWEAILERNG